MIKLYLLCVILLMINLLKTGESTGVFAEENISLDRQVKPFTSKLNVDPNLPQFVSYEVTTQEPCAETIIGGITRECDDFKLFVASGSFCASPPDWSDFSSSLESVGTNGCKASDSNHSCSGHFVKCPVQEYSEGSANDSAANAALCCVMFICTNLTDSCLLKAKATFVLGARLFKTQTAIKIGTKSLEVQGSGLSSEDLLFRCVDVNKKDLGCVVVTRTESKTELKTNLAIDTTGPVFASVKRKGIEENSEEFVQIAFVEIASWWDYKFEIGLIGCSILFLILMKSCSNKGTVPNYFRRAYY